MLLEKDTKTTKKKRRNKGGQPTVMTEKVLRELKEAFRYGCTDEEACLYAEICTTALYDYQKRNPGYSEQKATWKQTPFLKARRTIISALDEVGTARWFMERKKSDEFGKKEKIEHELPQLEGVSEELKEAIAKGYELRLRKKSVPHIKGTTKGKASDMGGGKLPNGKGRQT